MIKGILGSISAYGCPIGLFNVIFWTFISEASSAECQKGPEALYKKAKNKFKKGSKCRHYISSKVYTIQCYLLRLHAIKLVMENGIPRCIFVKHVSGNGVLKLKTLISSKTYYVDLKIMSTIYLYFHPFKVTYSASLKKSRLNIYFYLFLFISEFLKKLAPNQWSMALFTKSICHLHSHRWAY